jgi:hypothetical protein
MEVWKNGYNRCIIQHDASADYCYYPRRNRTVTLNCFMAFDFSARQFLLNSCVKENICLLGYSNVCSLADTGHRFKEASSVTLQTTRRYLPEYSRLHTHHRRNRRSQRCLCLYKTIRNI